LFRTAGFLVNDSTERARFIPFQTKVIKYTHLKTGVKRFGPYSHKDVRLRIDVGGLCSKHEDMVWATGIQLDKLCFSEMGLNKVLQKGGDKKRSNRGYDDITTALLLEFCD